MKKCRWLIYCFSLAIVLSSCHNSAAPAVKNTVAKNQIGMEEYLNAHLITVLPDSGKVRFMTDGSLGIGNWGDSWQSEFALGVGEKFQTQPDHHSSSSFEVRGISVKGIVVKYQTKFDHQSFGKDLITIDEGEIEISYKEKSEEIK